MNLIELSFSEFRMTSELPDWQADREYNNFIDKIH